MPFPSETFVGMFPSALQPVADELRAQGSQLTGWLSKEHKSDGSHAAITGDSATIADDVTAGGKITAEGDVIALMGSGKECGLGILSTVNGAPLLPSDVVRYGALLGGVTDGHFIESRGAQPPFLSGNELAIWNLGFSTTKPIVRFGSIAGVMTMIDGGSGASLNLGDSTERLASIYATDLYARGRTVAEGDWTDVAYSAGDFTAATGTWTVASGDVQTHAYSLVGKTMTVLFGFTTTSASAITADLKIPIPGGYTAARTVVATMRAIDAGGTGAAGLAIVSASGTTIAFFSTQNGGGWAIATNTTYVQGEITFPVQ